MKIQQILILSAVSTVVAVQVKMWPQLAVELLASDEVARANCVREQHEKQRFLDRVQQRQRDLALVKEHAEKGAAGDAKKYAEDKQQLDYPHIPMNFDHARAMGFTEKQAKKLVSMEILQAQAQEALDSSKFWFPGGKQHEDAVTFLTAAHHSGLPLRDAIRNHLHSNPLRTRETPEHELSPKNLLETGSSLEDVVKMRTQQTLKSE